MSKCELKSIQEEYNNLKKIGIEYLSGYNNVSIKIDTSINKNSEELFKKHDNLNKNVDESIINLLKFFSSIDICSEFFVDNDDNSMKKVHIILNKILESHDELIDKYSFYMKEINNIDLRTLSGVEYKRKDISMEFLKKFLNQCYFIIKSIVRFVIVLEELMLKHGMNDFQKIRIDYYL